jgi:hypothetical protein
MRRVGHFEFGLDRRPINLGPETAEVLALWEAGEEVRGWAIYWRSIYGHLLDQLAQHRVLGEAVLTVRHEDLCERPHETLTALSQHCGLDPRDPIIEGFAERLHYPAYYRPDFSAAEKQVIARETAEVAARLGY